MFELINSLRSELTRTPLSPAPLHTHTRLEVVKEVVQRLYAAAVSQHQASPSVNGTFNPEVTYCDLFHYDIFAAYNSSNNTTIRISPLLLIDSAEIPERFQIADVNDPRLNDNDFLQSCADWLHDKLALPRRSYTLDIFKMNFVFLLDRPKAKEALKFVMLHELGHMHNKDFDNIPIPNTLIDNIISISLPICVALALLLCFPLTPPFMALCATMTIATAFFTHYTLKAIPLAGLRNLEKGADLFAAESCPSAIDGGIYLFSMYKLNQQMQGTPAYLRWANDFFDPVRELFQDHPADSSRIAFLEAIKQQRQSVTSLNRRSP